MIDTVGSCRRAKERLKRRLATKAVEVGARREKEREDVASRRVSRLRLRLCGGRKVVKGSEQASKRRGKAAGAGGRYVRLT